MEYFLLQIIGIEIVINNIFGRNLDEVLEKKTEVEEGDKTVLFYKNG